MNPKQRKRKVRERSKKFIGVVSSLKAEPMLTDENLRYIMMTADMLGLRTLAKVAYDAMEVSRAKKEELRWKCIAEQCQHEVAILQGMLVAASRTLMTYERVHFRRRSHKGRAYRPEKKHVSRRT